MLSVRRLRIRETAPLRRWLRPQRVQSRRFSPMAWYGVQLERSPLRTKIITSGVLFGLGDIIAQRITRREGEAFDWPRLTRACIYGSIIFAPLAHFHFNFMEWFVVKKLMLTGTRMALVKVFIDQFTYFTLGINCIYLFSMAKMKGASNEGAVTNIKKNLWPILKVNWVVWPIAQIVNFKVIPVSHQLNFVLAVSLVWAGFLSWATGRKRHQPKEPRPPSSSDQRT